MLENPWIPSTPTKRQARFLAEFGREAIYGGAAGGGKSEALLMAAAQFVEVPDYAALLIRRSFPDLSKPGALIPRSKEWWLGKGPKWNEQQKTWTFPSGAKICFGFLERDDDVYPYQGSEWQYIGVDETTQHTEFRYRYLFSRLRKLATSRIPLRMRSASNPGGVGHEWVKKRFIVPGCGRTFIPAKLDDNPHLDREDYIRSLTELDPITRAQLLAGDWDAFEGGRFKKEWFRGFWVEQAANGTWRYYLEEGDPAGVNVADCYNVTICDPACRVKENNDPTAIGTFAITPAKDILVLDMVRDRIKLDQIVPKIAEVCKGYGPSWIGIESAGFQVALINEARKHPDIPAVRELEHEGKEKLVRATPAIIRAEAGQIYVPEGPGFPWVEDFLAELVQYTGDEDQDAHDDQVDVLAYLVQALDRLGLAGPLVVTPPASEHEGFGGLTGWGESDAD